MEAAEFLNLYPHRAPHVMWFLGAGCSVSAGLPSAAVLTWECKRAIYCNIQKIPPSRFADLDDRSFQSLIQSYFNSQAGHPKLWDDVEYSFYFERYLPDEGDRRRYLDRRMQGTKPSLGHLCLAALHAVGQARIIWTTNFDPLVERAFAQDLLGSQFPGGLTVAGLDCPEKAQQSIHDERWPLLVKLHGDFQYRKLMNTQAELQRQNETLQKSFIDQCNRYGLAVVGYSGRDHSVMSAMTEALRGPSPFPHGLFWFVRHGSVPAQPVVDLLVAARAKGIQAAYIEIGGFDELMADLFLPHHEALPAVRDIVKLQRARRTAVTPKYGNGNWPVIRTNALNVTDFPSTCTLFQANIGGQRDVKTAIGAHLHRVVAARKSSGILAFGNRPEIETIFAAFEPTGFDRHSILTKRLRYVDSAEHGLIYHALIQGLSEQTGLSRSKSHKGRVLYFRNPDAVRPEDVHALKEMGAVAVRKHGSQGPFIHQAVWLSLDFVGDRLWLLVEPTIHVTMDGDTPYTKADRVEIGREDLVKRYNKQSNDWLVFWISFLASKCGNPISVAFPDSRTPEATFTISTTSAYASRT